MTQDAGFLMSMAWKSSLVVAAAALAAVLFRRRSAAARHLIWAAALAGLALLPLVHGVAPGWRVEVARAAAAPVPAATVLDVLAGARSGSASVAAAAWWVWVGGFAFLVLRLCAGVTSIVRLRKSARAEEGFEGVLLSRRVGAPVVCGFWRPAIILPDEARRWPASRLRMVLLHERMHVARHDTRTFLLARLVAAAYWPNPLVWWAAGRMRREAERACDDGVLLQGEQPAGYAGELVEVVEGLRHARPLPEGGLAMGRVSELESRLKALLKSGVRRRKATPALVAGVGVLSLTMLVPIAAFQPAVAPGAGGIAGVVIDASGAVVPKARVTAALAETARKEIVNSGPSGEFALQPLPSGSYTLTVEKPGFARLRLEGIQVKAGGVTEVQPRLVIGQVSESMEVRAGRLAPAAPVPGVPPQLEVGGSVQATRIVHLERPSYPPDCKAEGIEGTVMLRATIGTDGSVSNLERVNQLVDARLAEAAIAAVKQWRYQPTLLNGAPVEVLTDIQINFALQ